MIDKRGFSKALAAIVGAVVLATGPSAIAAPPSMRDSVPDSQLTSYRALAKQFASPAAAEAAGYTKISDLAGIFCIADPAGSGAMGVHWVNLSLLFDGGQLDPTKWDTSDPANPKLKPLQT